LPTLALNEFSAREIQTFAEDLEKTNKKNDQENAGKKNSGHYQKNLDHRKTKGPERTLILQLPFS